MCCKQGLKGLETMLALQLLRNVDFKLSQVGSLAYGLALSIMTLLITAQHEQFYSQPTFGQIAWQALTWSSGDGKPMGSRSTSLFCWQPRPSCITLASCWPAVHNTGCMECSHQSSSCCSLMQSNQELLWNEQEELGVALAITLPTQLLPWSVCPEVSTSAPHQELC